MENDVNQNNLPENGERTFSQDDVNRIVGERLAKEKNKGEADYVKKEQELVQRELALTAKEQLSSMGLPVELHEALNCTSKEALEKSISIIQEAFGRIKADRAKTIIKGASPAERGKEAEDDPVEPALRKAMGLPK